MASVIGAACGPTPEGSVTATPAPPATSAATAVTTPSPTPTPRPLSVSYVSPSLAYTIRLPEGYRRSDCLSGLAMDTRSQPVLGSDTFTLLSTEQERAIGGHGHLPVVSGAQAWTFFVSALAVDMPAVELAEREGCPTCERVLPEPSPAPDPQLGRPPQDRIEAVTISGQEAARRIRDHGESFYVVRTTGRAYVIRFQEPYTPEPAHPRPPDLGPDPLGTVAATFQADPTTAIVLRTPEPQADLAAAREVAVRLASAFEAGDVDRIAALSVPTCWLDVVVEPGGGSAESVSRYLAQLRSRSRAGLRVDADPVLEAAQGGSSEPQLWVNSQWTEHGRTFRVNLRLRQVDGRWYWGGLYQFAPSP